MDMDEFQEADILWPDTEDELLAPFAPMDTEELYAGSASSVAPPVFRRRFQGFVFLSGGAGPPPPSLSAGASADADGDEEEWQEADVLWPDEPRGSGARSMGPFPGSSSSSCSGRASHRRVKPAAAARRDGWTTAPAASSSPIDIPADNVARRRRFRTAMNRRRS